METSIFCVVQKKCCHNMPHLGAAGRTSCRFIKILRHTSYVHLVCMVMKAGWRQHVGSLVQQQGCPMCSLSNSFRPFFLNQCIDLPRSYFRYLQIFSKIFIKVEVLFQDSCRFSLQAAAQAHSVEGLISVGVVRRDALWSGKPVRIYFLILYIYMYDTYDITKASFC